MKNIKNIGKEKMNKFLPDNKVEWILLVMCGLILVLITVFIFGFLVIFGLTPIWSTIFSILVSSIFGVFGIVGCIQSKRYQEKNEKSNEKFKEDIDKKIDNQTKKINDITRLSVMAVLRNEIFYRYNFSEIEIQLCFLMLKYLIENQTHNISSNTIFPLIEPNQIIHFYDRNRGEEFFTKSRMFIKNIVFYLRDFFYFSNTGYTTSDRGFNLYYILRSLDEYEKVSHNLKQVYIMRGVYKVNNGIISEVLSNFHEGEFHKGDKIDIGNGGIIFDHAKYLSHRTIQRSVDDEAYYIWEENGKKKEKDLENWLKAEYIINSVYLI